MSAIAAPQQIRGRLKIATDVAVSVPEGWSVAPRFARNTTEFVAVPADRQDEVKVPQRGPDGTVGPWTPRVTVFTETRANHQEAVDRLKEIAGELSTPATILTIGGWPALERRHLGDLPRRGWEEAENPDMGKAIFTTTAIAVDNVVVRFEGVLPPQAGAAVVEQTEAIGRGAAIAKTADPARTAREVEELKATPRRTFSLFKATASGALAAEGPAVHAQAGPGAALRIVSGSSEIEITSSTNGQDVVAAAQNNFRTSNDGGQTFGWSGGMSFGNRGDPSLAFGQSGRFYYAGIDNLLGCTGNPLFGCGTGISASTDRGHSFPFVADAVVCPSSGASKCFPDQEHIAVDRWNAGASGDQVYSVWRNFTAGEIPNIVCSENNGATWTGPLAVDSGYVPRVTVGQDGFVYVVYGQGGNIRINKYSSCTTGLAAQTPTFPLTITAYTGVTCPVAGLDRCNDGNVLSSYMLAVDETAPTHVFLAYADTDGSGGENILVRKSTDGGATWSAPTTVNGGAAGVHRYMPWISINGGTVHTSWYDRRAGNDNTDFYRRALNAGSLALGAETSLQQNVDPECNSGWPCGVRATGDSETCPTQPQLAGFCQDGAGNGSQARCDFTTGPACPLGEACRTSGGCPKYGDYNGNAASGGWAFSAWASRTAPPLSVNSGNIDTYFEATQIGPNPDVTINKTGPASVNANNSIHYVITVTNTGTTLATIIQVNDTITSPFASYSTSAGWSCPTVPSVGSTGTLTCNLASLVGGASATIDVYVTAPNAIGSATDTATVTSANDGNTGNNTSPTVTTQILSPSDVYGTKVWSSAWGTNLYPGAPVVYTIVLTNIAANDQFDGSGHEFVDVVPAQLTVNNVSATSGIAANVGNTVNWDGSIPAGGGTVTITINCTINLGTEGAIVSNQGTIHYDIVGDGSNLGTRLTDDPNVGGSSDPTVFQVRVPIPTLGEIGLLALLVLLAVTAVIALRRRHRTA